MNNYVNGPLFFIKCIINSWQDRINTDIKMINGTTNIETAIDRDVWWRLIETAKRLNIAHKTKTKKCN